MTPEETRTGLTKEHDSMNIKDHMKANSYTQSDAARAWGVSRQLISHWIKRGAIVVDGRVYLPVRDRKCA